MWLLFLSRILIISRIVVENWLRVSLSLQATAHHCQHLTQFRIQSQYHVLNLCSNTHISRLSRTLACSPTSPLLLQMDGCATRPPLLHWRYISTITTLAKISAYVQTFDNLDGIVQLSEKESYHSLAIANPHWVGEEIQLCTWENRHAEIPVVTSQVNSRDPFQGKWSYVGNFLNVPLRLGHWKPLRGT